MKIKTINQKQDNNASKRISKLNVFQNIYYYTFICLNYTLKYLDQ